jgi:hypothetical protein
MKILKEEKEEILKKYHGETSEKVLNHLKRNYQVVSNHLFEPNNIINFININDKNYMIKGNRKFLVGKIFELVVDKFPDISEDVIRRTVKKYLNVLEN